MNTKKYFKLAKNASKFSDYNKKNIHIGSVLVYKNKIIANGWNTQKTSPIQYQYNKHREIECGTRNFSADDHLPCIHSEMKCLIDTKYMDIERLFNIDIEHWREKELLLNRNSSFLVTGFDTENNIIEVDYIG